MHMDQKEVHIYSTAGCHFCHMTKDFFNEKGIKYTDYNVGEDLEKRKEMVEMTGQMGVPVVHIGDDIVIGFDQKKISELLGIS